MKVHVEWTSGCMRLLQDEYGGPYVWSASVVRKNDTLWIIGAAALPKNPHALRAAMRAWAKSEGIKTVIWERRKKTMRIERHEV